MRTLIVGTAGHIDHGKSSLVRALTGTDPDRLKEEKARGITIELGFAHAPIGDGVVASLVDVPGHERFVRAMLAGVGGIDVVLLVVAADESVMPQTREHFDICRLLGVARGIVVLTKCDAADATAIEVAALEVRELVAGSFLEGAPILPVSAVTGEGLDALRAALTTVAQVVPTRARDGAARLPVDRAFSMKGFGTVVTGTLVAGVVAVDDELTLLPTGARVKVRGLHVHGQPRPSAVAGERAAMNLSGVEVGEVPRGAVVSAAGALLPTRRIDARLTLLPGAALKHGARVRVHHGTAEALARVSVAGPSGVVAPGGAADVRLRFETPAVVTRGDRFIVRSYSPLVTIGGGVVLDPLPPRAGVRTARGVDRMAALQERADASDDVRAAIRVMVADAGLAGVSTAALRTRVGATVEALTAALQALARDGVLLLGGEWVVDAGVAHAPVAAVLAGLTTFHQGSPLAAGMPLEAVRGRWFNALPPAVFEKIVAELVVAGTVTATDTLSLASHRVTLSAEETQVYEWIDRRFAAAGFSPPDGAILAAESRRAPALVDRVVQLMVKQRRLIRVDTLLFHRDVLDRLKQEVAARKVAGGGIATVDVKSFKDTYDVSRKFAIPLLEYLDRERVTRRAGDVRIVL